MFALGPGSAPELINEMHAPLPPPLLLLPIGLCVALDFVASLSSVCFFFAA